MLMLRLIFVLLCVLLFDCVSCVDVYVWVAVKVDVYMYAGVTGVW